MWRKYLSLLKVIPIWGAVMTGSLSLVREAVTLFSQRPDPIWQKNIFWSCVWIAFIISITTAWVLKHQELIAEKTKNEKPDIQGETKEVFFDQTFNVELFDGEHNYEDFCFTINLYISNHRAETTIKEFKLALIARGRLCGGEKHSADGFYVQRRAGRERLIDVEESNDVPLKHSRNGWLRFVVIGVEISENERELQLELDAIDKDGTSYRLISLPRSEWQKNSLQGIPRIIHERELY
jgi:hypothetical protein